MYTSMGLPTLWKRSSHVGLTYRKRQLSAWLMIVFVVVWRHGVDLIIHTMTFSVNAVM